MASKVRQFLAVLALVALTGAAARDPVGVRYLGSPDGSYKLTLQISEATVTGTLQRLLIPNETLWQQTLPSASGFVSGFVTDAGNVVILSDSISNADPVISVLNLRATVVASYSLDELAAVLDVATGTLRGAGESGGWISGSAELSGESEVSIPMKRVSLLVNTVDGSLTVLMDQNSSQGANDE